MNIWCRAWLASVRVQVTEYNEMTKLSMTVMSSEEGVSGLSIRRQSVAVSSGRVLHFGDLFPVPEKKDVLYDPVRVCNAGGAFALSEDIVLQMS